jgi:hypothetical protein
MLDEQENAGTEDLLASGSEDEGERKQGRSRRSERSSEAGVEETDCVQLADCNSIRLERNYQ